MAGRKSPRPPDWRGSGFGGKYMRAFEFVMSVLTFVAMIVGGAVFAGIAALIVSVFASTGAAITTFVVLMIPAVAMALYVWLDDASVR